MANQLLKLANGEPAPDPNSGPPPYRVFLYHKTEPARIFTSQTDVDAALKDGWQDTPVTTGDSGQKTDDSGKDKNARIKELEERLAESDRMVEMIDQKLKEVEFQLEAKTKELEEANAALELAQAKLDEFSKSKKDGKK